MIINFTYFRNWKLEENWQGSSVFWKATNSHIFFLNLENISLFGKKSSFLLGKIISFLFGKMLLLLREIAQTYFTHIKVYWNLQRFSNRKHKYKISKLLRIIHCIELFFVEKGTCWWQYIFSIVRWQAKYMGDHLWREIFMQMNPHLAKDGLGWGRRTVNHDLPKYNIHMFCV